MNTTENKRGARRKFNPLVRRVFFTMVLLPSKGWTRIGNGYREESVAESWLDFVSKCNGDRPTRVEHLDLGWIGGRLDDETIEALDKRFNLDPPNVTNEFRNKQTGDEK